MPQILKKLNPVSRDVLSASVEFCHEKSNFFVDLEHYVFCGLQNSDADFEPILKYYDIDTTTVLKQLDAAVDRRITGGRQHPAALSPHLLMCLERAWHISSLELELPFICTSSILLSIIDYDTLRGVMLDSCPLLLRIPRIQFRKDLPQLTVINGQRYDLSA